MIPNSSYYVPRVKLSQYFFSKSFGKCTSFDILLNVLAHLRAAYLLPSAVMADWYAQRVYIILRTCGIHFQHRAHLSEINYELCVLLIWFKTCSIFFYTSLFMSISWNRSLTRKRLTGWASEANNEQIQFCSQIFGATSRLILIMVDIAWIISKNVGNWTYITYLQTNKYRTVNLWKPITLIRSWQNTNRS